MVGGTVIGVARGPEGTLLHVQGIGSDHRHNLSVRVVENRRSDGRRVFIGTGDSVWWQAGHVMWTPAESPRMECGVDFDIQLPKVGYSH